MHVTPLTRCLHTCTCNARAHKATNVATGWTATIELIATLRKGSRQRKTVVIQKDSVNFNFGRRLTYWLQLPPSTFTCLTIAFLSHDLDTACTVQTHVEYTIYHHFLYFVYYYNVTTCTDIYSSPTTQTCTCTRHSSASLVSLWLAEMPY